MGGCLREEIAKWILNNRFGSECDAAEQLLQDECVTLDTSFGPGFYYGVVALLACVVLLAYCEVQWKALVAEEMADGSLYDDRAILRSIVTTTDAYRAVQDTTRGASSSPTA